MCLHYKVVILDKDERIDGVLTDQADFHKIHTFKQEACILLVTSDQY